jgi:hypothetical protein
MSDPDEVKSLWSRASKGVTTVETARQVAQRMPSRGKDDAEERRKAEEQRKGWYDTAIEAVKIRARGGFPGYAAKNLRIRTKTGSVVPFEMNAAQLLAHEMAEKQIETTGYVRLLVLKGRQMGLSTYIGGRGYWKSVTRTGQSAYILAHELTATDNLFDMVKRYHENLDPRFRPHTARSNTKELVFDRLKSKYTVGTAARGQTGRSLTVQFFHGSEVAFWPQAKDIAAGLLQAIGLLPGTEIWLESTANGTGNYFHTAVTLARKGMGEFQLVFLPWFMDATYVRPALPGFEAELTLEDEQYRNAYSLTLDQMAWRAAKIAEFAMAEGGNVEAATMKFAQEYPATPEEAFLGDNAKAFIRAVSVKLARNAYARAVKENHGDRPRGYGPKIMGIDPSYVGADRFRVWCRQGSIAYRAGAWEKKKMTESFRMLIPIFEREQPDQIVVDAGGVGGPLCDMIAESEWGDRLVAVLSNDAPDDPERAYNKRAEMWADMRDWLIEAPQSMIEDDDAIQTDLTSIQPVRDVKGRIKLESKDDLRRRDLPSPDDGDALGLTFAYPSPATDRRGGGVRRPSPWGTGLGGMSQR